MPKIIFVGNPDFASKTLDRLVELNVDIPLVITQKSKVRSRKKVEPSEVNKMAVIHNLAVYETDDINDEDAINKIDEINPDFIIVVAFGQFIKDKLLEKYKDRIINIHASILPKYRGASPITEVILKGEEKTGVSIMLIDKGMDTGDVLKVSEQEINGMKYQELSDSLAKLGAESLVEVINNFEKYYQNRQVQDNSKASLTKFVYKSMGHIDFDDYAENIINKYRAFHLWPKIYFLYKDENVKVHEFEVIDKINDQEAGKIFKVDEKGIYVNTRDKTLVLTVVQFPNKKPMMVKEIIKGNNIENIKLQ